MKIVKYLLSGINILISIIAIISLFVFKMSENVVYIMMMSVMIGWIIPYFGPLITGLAILNDSHYKRALIFNIISILMIIFLLIMIKILFDKKMIFMLVTYIVILVINIINIIYLSLIVKKDYDKNKDKRKRAKEILKKKKEENNGAVL